MADDLTVKYYGLEREDGEWKPCGIIGATDDIPYTDIRNAIEHLDGFRVRPIENHALWTDVFNEGKIIEFKAFCAAILILCTK